MHHRVGQPGDGQFRVFSHIHQLDGFSRHQAGLQVADADGDRGGWGVGHGAA